MLAFAVYRDSQPLAQWPDYANSRACCLYLADERDRPVERAFDLDYARLICYCPPDCERRLYLRYPVPGFGDPILRTRLLPSGEVLRNLAVELALGRLELLDSTVAEAKQQHRRLPAALTRQLDAARRLTAEAVALADAGDAAVASAVADQALAVSVPAGEALANHLARQRFAERRQARGLRDVLLGCGGFSVKPETPRGQHFLQAFNYATLPFYLNGMEPVPDQVEHERVLRQARSLHRRGLQLKGHPLVWTYTPCLPAHRRGMDFAACCDAFRARIFRDVPPFHGVIHYWDIINEAHDTPWANSLGFTSEQMVELTGLAAETTRQAAPKSRLVVNVCLPFGEYAAGAPGRVTTLEYVKACLDAGIDFDIIGIQFYYGGGLMQYCWDMLEISRILDAYAALGKEIHITELGTPSAMGPDPNAMIKEGNEVGLWHTAWSEETQADWVEQFYTICLSKPAITALTWWSFSDAEGVFWPHSGLLNAQDEPKPAYERVLALRKLIDE